MNRRFSNYKLSNGDSITLVKLDKSGGCVDRDEAFMKQTQEASIKEYFFGDPKRTLSPQTQQVNFDDMVVYKITEGAYHTYRVKRFTNLLPSKLNACSISPRRRRGQGGRLI